MGEGMGVTCMVYRYVCMGIHGYRDRCKPVSIIQGTGCVSKMHPSENERYVQRVKKKKKNTLKVD